MQFSSKDVKAKENDCTPSQSTRRKSGRGVAAAIQDLASILVEREKSVVFVTGAGISAASGVRPFRTHIGSTQLAHPKHHGVLPTTAGLWNSVIWSTGTRQAFRKNPTQWYTDFWLPHFMGGKTYYPNMGHYALQEILQEFDKVTQITQNIDGLQPPSPRLIEAHGRIGLYKCLPNADSDTDEDSDDDERRTVHLGHRRKSRLMREQQSKLKKDKLEHIITRNHNKRGVCRYSFDQSLKADQLEPVIVRDVFLRMERQQNQLGLGLPPSLKQNSDLDVDVTKDRTLSEAPICPNCGSFVLPQALLFDEGYHSHAHYQFERMEEVLANADVLVFCGTSFSVHLTETALNAARDRQLPVYNFNLHDSLAATPRLNVINILGPAQETLPRLMRCCRELMEC